MMCVLPSAKNGGLTMGMVNDVKCHNCGAPLTLKAGEVVITCDYCGTAFNAASDQKFFLKHSIIPCRIDKKGILETVGKWMSTGGLKPSNLKKTSRIDLPSLTFLPFYVVHTNVTTTYEGFFTKTGGKVTRSGTLHKEYYWKVLGRRGSKFPTREYEIPLTGKEDFNLSKIPDGAKYLNAEFDEKDAEDIAKGEIADNQRFLISAQVNEMYKTHEKFETEDIEFVHAPIWKVDYTYGGSSYQLLICASTGEVIRGDIPPPDQSIGGFFSDLKKAFIGK
jgi:hypothetical protein